MIFVSILQAIKSPKDTSLVDQTETHTKDNHLPVIQSDDRPLDGCDKGK